MRAALVVLVVLCGTARADDDTRPADLTIPVPDADFTPAKLPKDVNTGLPEEGWWKKKKPGPKGSKMKKGTARMSGHSWRYFNCDGKSKQPRPHTAFRADGKGQREAGWEDAAGERHGMFLSWISVYEQKGIYVHGKEEGRHEETPVGSGDIRFTTWKTGVRHGLERRGNSGKPLLGYFVDGKRVGVWLTTQGPLDDTVRARHEYVDGKRHGTQRWWYADGKLLAKGEFTAGAGSWTIYTEAGKVHSTVDCAKEPNHVLCDYDDVPPLEQF